MARTADRLQPSDKPVTFHAPIPRPLYLRISYLCGERDLTRSEFLFHAVNALSVELGMDPLVDSVIDGYSPYPADSETSG